MTGAPSTRWNRAFALAAGGHALALAGLLLWAGNDRVPVPDTVIELELPPLPSGAVEAQAAARPVTTPQPQQAESPPVDAPLIQTPLPPEALTVAPKPAAPAPVAAPVPAPPSVAQAPTPAPSIGDDPRAKKAEANYYQTLMAYLARRKDYPAEARQARQQGIVKVRFTIDARGNISGESVKASSGFAVLDSATLAMLRRVSPVPPIPREMGRDTITLSLPIEYSLTSR